MTDQRPVFQHPPWMVGIMLILGVLSLFVGLTLDPFWLVIGSPAILTLLVFIGVRVVLLRRSIASPPGLDRPEPSSPDGDVEDRP